MKTERENSCLTVFLKERARDLSLPSFEQELEEAFGEKGEELALETDILPSLSGAGWRALRKLQKKTGKTLRIREAYGEGGDDFIQGPDTFTLASLVERDPEWIPQMGRRCAWLLKELHRAEVPGEVFRDRKASIFDWLEKIAPALTAGEKREMEAFLAAIPERESLLCGDFQLKNIFVEKENRLFVEIGEGAYGHPVFDMASLIALYQILALTPQNSRAQKRQILGFDEMQAPLLLQVVIGTYFELADPGMIMARIGSLLPYGDLYWFYQTTQAYGFQGAEMERTLGPLLEKMLPRIERARPLNW